MSEHLPKVSHDGLSVELEDGRRVFIDDLLAEAHVARGAEVRRLVADFAARLSHIFAALRATPADRAVELPGNRLALQIAARFRTDPTLRRFVATSGTARFAR